MERHVVDGLFALLAVSRELLHTRLALQIPQADGAVVTWVNLGDNQSITGTDGWRGVDSDLNKLTSGHEVQAVRINGQAGDGIQVGHHGVDQLTCTARGRRSTY